MAAPQADQALQEAIEALSEQIEQLSRQIYTRLRSRTELAEHIEYLLTIPGVDRLTTATVLAETAGFAEFGSISQLISFSGYDVVIQQSGQWAGQPQISKQGSKYIRRAMYMPASTVVRNTEDPSGSSISG